MGNRTKIKTLHQYVGFSFPGGAVVKNTSANTGGSGHTDFTLGSGRSPGERNGNPLQNSCLEKSVDRESWWDCSLWGREESDTTERLSMHKNIG